MIKTLQNSIFENIFSVLSQTILVFPSLGTDILLHSTFLDYFRRPAPFFAFVDHTAPWIILIVVTVGQHNRFVSFCRVILFFKVKTVGKVFNWCRWYPLRKIHLTIENCKFIRTGEKSSTVQPSDSHFSQASHKYNLRLPPFDVIDKFALKFTTAPKQNLLYVNLHF